MRTTVNALDHFVVVPRALALSPAAAMQISSRLAVVVACPIMVLLAAQLQNMSRRVRWIVAPILLLGLGFGIQMAVDFRVIDRIASHWQVPAAALVSALAMASRRPVDSQPASS